VLPKAGVEETMGELEGKINEILNSPEDMQKIMNLAQSLTGGGGKSGAGSGAPAQKKAISAPADPPPEAEGTADASDLLGGLNITPEMLKTIGSVVGGLGLTSKEGESGGNVTASLLDAITPYLKPERRRQLQRAMTLAKMGKVAGIVFKDSGGGDRNV